MTLLFVLLLAAADPARDTTPHATIPLEEWDRLKKLQERPSLTVVDLLRVEGSFARRDLAVTLAGRSAGTWPTEEFLTAEGARLHSCEGDAVVSRAESGAFAVTPLAQRFRVRCRVALDGSDRLAGVTTRAVLEVAAGVQDGELVAGEAGDGIREFSVVRAIAGAREDLPPSVTGRYHLTLLPDEARFLYRLEVRNPARGHRRFAVALRDAEHVESVGAPVAWDVEGRTYRFDLPPGETTLALTGRLTAASFTPPVEASVQYLLLESHPLVRPDVRTAAKRVGVGETGLSPRYRGAQAFLADGAEVAWTATRLEALKTAGLALEALEQVFFLATDGTVRGEATFAIDNQGAPALTLPTPGEPTFASIGGEPVFLTRDAEGRLLLPLGQGAQPVVVQDARPFRRALGFAFARLELPRLGVPASRAAVQLRYPAEWIPLYEELAPASRLHLLDAGEVVLLLVLLGAAARLLAIAGLPRRRRWVLAGALTLLAALSPAVRGVALAAAAALFLALLVAATIRRLAGTRRLAALAGLGLAVLVALAISDGVLLAPAWRAPSPEAASGYMNYADKAMRHRGDEGTPALAAQPAAPEEEVVVTASGAAKPSAGYEGLPARIAIPPGARRTVFDREMLATDAPRPVFAVLVSARLVAALTTGVGLLLLGLALAFRRDLAEGARTFRARLVPAAPGGTAAPAAAG
ncbi:MAG TPA: hypothetical protein VFL83_12780 [Anaeromyxobacter sp.]|nr:hypothetical protein [Anaeromyxobacter sp.]